MSKHFPSFLNETFGLGFEIHWVCFFSSFLQENKRTFHEIFHEWYALDLCDHPCVISQPWQPVKDTNNTANSKLQMVIDCLDVLGDSMPLEVTFVYSPNFRKCWKCIKECWLIDEIFRVQTVTFEKSLLWSLWSQKTVLLIVTNFLFSCVYGSFHIHCAHCTAVKS